MDKEAKIKAYHAGQYVAQVPPSCTAFWSIDSWIRWIDYNGDWRVPDEHTKHTCN
jgi:hypothetical protein